MASVAPLFPIKNFMKSVVPTPDVDWRDKDAPTAVPPIKTGRVREVSIV